MTSLGWQTFSEMVSEVGRVVGDSGTGRRRPIKDAMMRAYDTIAAAVEWPQLVAFDETGLRGPQSDTTLKSLESGDSYVPAPFYVGKVRSMVIHDVTEGAIEVVQPGLLAEIAGSQFTLTGRPRIAAQVGVTAQTVRMSAAGPLTAYATSTPNNDNIHTVTVELKRDANPVGSEVVHRVSGSFSTGVALPGNAARGYPISKVVLPRGWAGDFQLRDSDGVNVVDIRPVLVPVSTALDDTRSVARPLYRVWPVPDQDYGLTWTWWRRPRRLAHDDDTPEMPVSEYLIAATAAEILRQMDKPQAAMLQDRQAENFMRMVLRQNNRGPIHVIPKGGSFVSMTGVDIGRF